ncbi:MAG: insulinase family protein [Phycisphaeraceae bacterium]|nr:insulinase family protein [Phycisphaeraceae bacterium]
MPIEIRELECGAVLLVEPMAGVKSCALNWSLPAGAAAEPAERLGLSGIVAEMVQRGAGGLTSREHADALDAAGVSRGLDTGMRTSRLSATFVGQDLDQAIPLLADMIVRPNMDKDAFAPAQSLALQELEALDDDPQERAAVEAMARHLPPPFNRSNYGTRDGLSACTPADALKFLRSAYVPRGSIIALAGDVDPMLAQDALDAALTGWTGEKGEPTTRGQAPRGRDHIHDDGAQVQIIVMRDAPSEGTSQAACERLATAVLSGGMSGRLFTEVREKRGLCYAVHASYTPERDTGWQTAYVGTTPERAAESLEVLFAELDRLATPQGAPTEEEFQRARVGLKSRIVFGGESTAARAGALANDYRKLGRCRSLEERVAEIDAIDLPALRRYLADYDRGVPTVLTLGPAPASAPMES